MIIKKYILKFSIIFFTITIVFLGCSSKLPKIHQYAINSDLNGVMREVYSGRKVDLVFQRYTPLVLASSRGNLKLVNYLVEKGANINFRAGKEKTTALIEATISNQNHIVAYLLSHGAEKSPRLVNDITKVQAPYAGKNALEIAKDNKNTNLIELLSDKKIEKLNKSITKYKSDWR